MRSSKLIRPGLLSLLSALIFALLWKAFLLFRGVFSFNSDEAIVGLMARHILQGERPLFFYGQAYMGSLDAYLVAGGFVLFGEEVWVIRLVQALLYVAVIVTTAWIAVLVYQTWRAAILAAWFLVIPTVNVTLYTTVSLGGYGEALLIGNLLILTAFYAVDVSESNLLKLGLWFLWGGLAGLGVWVFGLTLIYILPTGLYLLWNLWQELKNRHFRGLEGASFPLLALGGLLIGALPLFLFSLQSGAEQPIKELMGSAIAGVEGVSWLSQIWIHLLSIILFGITVTLGFRPPWDTQILVPLLVPLIVIFWILVFACAWQRWHDPSLRSPKVLLLAGVGLTLLVAFVFTPFGADPSGRYFVPLAIPLTLLAVDLLLHVQTRMKQAAWILPGIILLYNGIATLEMARQNPPGLTTQFYPPSRVDHAYDSQLIAFLEEEGETHGYTNYWVAYPLAFLSKEQLIYVPHLPYHSDLRYTRRDDRYLPYTQQVANAHKISYITTHNPELDALLRQRMAEQGMTYQEKVIGDYHIYYRLSKPVRPEELLAGAVYP